MWIKAECKLKHFNTIYDTQMVTERLFFHNHWFLTYWYFLQNEKRICHKSVYWSTPTKYDNLTLLCFIDVFICISYYSHQGILFSNILISTIYKTYSFPTILTYFSKSSTQNKLLSATDERMRFWYLIKMNIDFENLIFIQ